VTTGGQATGAYCTDVAKTKDADTHRIHLCFVELLKVGLLANSLLLRRPYQARRFRQSVSDSNFLHSIRAEFRGMHFNVSG
jgi:hypothetical protein